MRIVITGATGLIGRSLNAFLLSQAHQITVLTRDPQRANDVLGSQVTCWSTLDDQHDLNNFDAVINLAGEPIAEKRWTPQQKEILCQSRWQITERLTTLIRASSQPPAVFISGSAVGFYGDQGQAVVTEDEAPMMSLLICYVNAGRASPELLKVSTLEFAYCALASYWLRTVGRLLRWYRYYVLASVAQLVMAVNIYHGFI